MLSTVEFRSPGGELLSLSFENPSGGFLITDIDGLGPVKASIATSTFAAMDGVQFHSARREGRNLLFKIELIPDWATQTMESLRWRLYDFFMTKAQVSIRFIFSNELEVDISGIVESCEPDIFAKEPTMNVVVFCTNPDLVDITPVVVEGGTVEDDTEMLIEYVGTEDTGFTFTLEVDRDFDELDMYLRGPDNIVQTLNFGGNILDLDVLEIVTIKGSKSITVIRASVPFSALYGKMPQSAWPKLSKGDNYIRVVVGESTGTPIPYTVTYTTKYGAV